ncbi:ADP-ribosylation factor-like protein 6-interacting protein 6 [Tachypleus tridentatus]|uniref:ADP-ribosylation factor-like protein 6-interacting protein 6 n=1 Tax=Tachypleus tridentatus TaxID=6853 RepID=UPI003FD4FFCB
MFLNNSVPTYLLQLYHLTNLETPDILLAVGLGLVVSLFTWMVVYLDSSQPGVEPPSPLSPRKIRMSSGHSYHIGYIMAVVNGFLFSALALTW